MQRLVSSTVARNMWAIMTKFNRLPTDKGLQELTDEQVDFIILSMNQDAKEARAALNGSDVVTYSDGDPDYISDIYEAPSGTDWKIMRDGQDPEKIYEQVKQATHQADPGYQEKTAEEISDIVASKLAERGIRNAETEEYINRKVESIKNRINKHNNMESKGKEDKTVDVSELSADSDYYGLL